MMRAKSVYAGKPAYDMSQMICSPAMARQFRNAKTKGYLTGRAKTPNRWGIERVDINASECLQSMTCQHSATLWLVSGDTVRAPTCNAAELYAIACLVGAKFDKAGREHLSEYADRYESLKDAVATKLDQQFGTQARPATTDSVTAKKRSAEDVAPAKKQAVESAPQTASTTNI